MRAHLLFISALSILLGAGGVAAEELAFVTKHFRVQSAMDSRYATYVSRNAEAFYDNMTPQYFPKGFTDPLVIEYSTHQSESRKKLASLGLDDDINYGKYVGYLDTTEGKEPTLFTHRVMDGGRLSGWGTLFHEIVHHFIAINHTEAPTWFNEGLASFLGERTRIVKGAITVGRPNPWREKILRELIEDGWTPDVEEMANFSSTRFYDDEQAYPFARTLFYWLHHSGKLDSYLKIVKSDGYSIDILAKIAGSSIEQINQDLLKFIQDYCLPASYIFDADNEEDGHKKELLLRKAIALQPEDASHDHLARIRLAEYFYYEAKNNEQCRRVLSIILNDEGSQYFYKVMWLMGDIAYSEDKYNKAIEYYKRSLEYTDYYEHGPWLLYWIGSSHLGLKDLSTAKIWYEQYLKEEWEPQRNHKWVDSAQKLLQWFAAKEPS